MFFHLSLDSRFFFSATTLHFSLLNLPVFLMFESSTCGYLTKLKQTLLLTFPRLVTPQWPSCSRYVWCSVCCQLSSLSQCMPHPREVATSPSTPPSWFAVSRAQRGLQGTPEPLDHQGPWDPWGPQGGMAQMGRMERRDKRELEVVIDWLSSSVMSCLGSWRAQATFNSTNNI